MPFSPVFDPPIPELERTRTIKDWEWQEIAGIAVTPIPDEWLNPNIIPYLKLTRIDQGMRGTCTGYSMAMAQYILQIIVLLKKIPTAADFDQIRRNIKTDIGCRNGLLVTDRLIPQFPSPGFAYMIGRWKAFGNPIPHDAPPEGGYVRSCVQAWCETGMILESMCVTAKDPRCVPDFYDASNGWVTEAKVLEEAAKHTAEGYAQLSQFDAICECIYRDWEAGGLGGVLISTNLFGDYNQFKEATVAGQKVYLYSNGGGGKGDVVGAHAQLIVGYSKSQQCLVVASSWGTSDQDGPFLNGWSRTHHERAASMAFKILDAHETDIGTALYCTTMIDANVPCQFTIDVELQTTQPAKASLKAGQTYMIRATPTIETVEPYQEKDFMPDKSMEVPGPDGDPVINVRFVFTPKSDPHPNVPDWIKAFVEWILKILGRGK